MCSFDKSLKQYGGERKRRNSLSFDERVFPRSPITKEFWLLYLLKIAAVLNCKFCSAIVLLSSTWYDMKLKMQMWYLKIFVSPFKTGLCKLTYLKIQSLELVQSLKMHGEKQTITLYLIVILAPVLCSVYSISLCVLCTETAIEIFICVLNCDCGISTPHKVGLQITCRRLQRIAKKCAIFLLRCYCLPPLHVP